MKRHLPFYLLVAAVVVVGAVAFGVPAASLWILGVVVLCPLMMIFMMGGMHGEDGRGTHDDDSQRGSGPTEDRGRHPRLRPGPLDKH